MKRGDRIVAYYDGKRGRAVEGVVLRHGPRKALVQHPRWAGDGPGDIAEYWVRWERPKRSPAIKYGYRGGWGGWDRCGLGSIMRDMLGLPGDWYRVVRRHG